MSGDISKGQMPLEGHLKIQKNHEFLLEELLPIPIVDYLHSSFVIGHEFEMIQSEEKNNGRRAGVRKLLEVLKHSGEHSYIKFIEALNECGFKSAAKKLNETSVDEELIEAYAKPHPWIDSMEERKLQAAVTESQLSSFSGTFGLNWESVALHLGCSQAQISQMKMSNPYSLHMQIFSTLNKWRQKKASGATLGVFLTALRECEVAEINWTKVQEIVDRI